MYRFLFQSHAKRAEKAMNPGDGKKKKTNIKMYIALHGTVAVQEETKAYFEMQPGRQRVLVDRCPLQGLIHLHFVPSVLSLPSAPLRQPSLSRCAAVCVEQ